VFEVSGAQATVLEIQPLRHANCDAHGIDLPAPSLESKECQSAIHKQEFVNSRQQCGT